jgi:hypothetical protein
MNAAKQPPLAARGDAADSVLAAVPLWMSSAQLAALATLPGVVAPVECAPLDSVEQLLSWRPPALARNPLSALCQASPVSIERQHSDRARARMLFCHDMAGAMAPARLPEFALAVHATIHPATDALRQGRDRIHDRIQML